ncbi:MAG: LysM peptidoglycan-binding domain-containing protein [Bacteroidota bacterium]|jgi:membrane-bound lytic murein transglycosylase D
MLRVRVLISLFFIWSWAFSQSDIQLKIKSLEQKGLPYFWNAEIELSIRDWLKNENQSTSIFLGRYQYYSAMINPILADKKLPWFLAYMPAGSTGFEPRYRDEGGSSGMWPMGFTMGKKYGLKQTALFDERRDPTKSSQAALSYLNDLHIIYKDWLKAITAFRIGAIRMNQIIHELDGELDFERIYLLLEPEERIPIIQFYSAVVVLHYAKDFGIKPLPFAELGSAQVLSVSEPVPFSLLNEKLGIGLMELRMLNPELRADVIPYMGSDFVFRLPKEYVSRYNSMRDSIPGWLHGFGSNDHGVVRRLPNVEIKEEVVAMENKDTAVLMEIASNDQSVVDAVGITPPRPKTSEYKVWVYYRVKAGDAVYTLSDVFDCSPEQLKQWNRLRSNSLVVGTQLKFYVPATKKSFYTKINSMSISQKRNLAAKD